MTTSDTSTPANPSHRAGIEGRAKRRYRCRENHIVRLAIRPSFVNISALVHNVSATGMGFILDRQLERGTVLALSLAAGRQGTSLIRIARVTHVRRHVPVKNAPWMKKQSLLKSLLGFLSSGSGKKAEEKIWLIGSRLNPPLTEAELESLC